MTPKLATTTKAFNLIANLQILLTTALKILFLSMINGKVYKLRVFKEEEEDKIRRLTTL